MMISFEGVVFSLYFVIGFIFAYYASKKMDDIYIEVDEEDYYDRKAKQSMQTIYLLFVCFLWPVYAVVQLIKKYKK